MPSPFSLLREALPNVSLIDFCSQFHAPTLKRLLLSFDQKITFIFSLRVGKRGKMKCEPNRPLIDRELAKFSLKTLNLSLALLLTF